MGATVGPVKQTPKSHINITKNLYVLVQGSALTMTICRYGYGYVYGLGI